jgi:hypothetical protein
VAKAKPEPSTSDEAWFNEVVLLLAERCGSIEDAQDRLVRGLQGGVPWSHLGEDGIRREGDAAYWNCKAGFLQINRLENSAFYDPLIASDDLSDIPASVVGIKVNRLAVLALVPGEVMREDIEALQPGVASDEVFTSASKPQGWQAERALRFLRKHYPPEGKTPHKKTYKTLRAEFTADPEVIEENKRRLRRAPSQDVMSACRRYLGFTDD